MAPKSLIRRHKFIVDESGAGPRGIGSGAPSSEGAGVGARSRMLSPAGERPAHGVGVKYVRLSQKYPPGYNLGVAHRDSSVAHREGRTPWLEWSCWERAWRDTPLPST